TGSNPLAVFHLLFFVFTEEPYATIIAILGLIGLAHRLMRRDYLLPLWVVIPFLVEGRSAAGPAAIPLAMLAAIGLMDVVIAALQPKVESEAQQADRVSSVERNVLLYVFFYLIFSTSQFGLQLSQATLYPPDQEAMKWVQEHTPANSRFLVLTGTSSVSCDSVLEWFPALTGRQSIFTVQGTEWTKGVEFNNYVRSTYAVQECLPDGGASCLDEAVSRSAYDFIYLSKTLRVDNCIPLDLQRTFSYFLEHIHDDESFETVYETDGVVILRKQ
ncbi:MAG TPA: hypothetical protein VKE92_04940, partial [Anaerolineales bacterium]|nr:hypothetical protein [Anaerolineales bacterium]